VLLIGPLVTVAAQVVGLLLLQGLLGDVAQTELGQGGDDVRPRIRAGGEQAVDLLTHDRAGRYPSHGLGLLSVDCSVFRIEAQAALRLQEG